MEVRRDYSIFAASHLKLMITNRISTNLYVAEDPRFGNYNKDIVYRLLQQVQIDFSNWIGNDVFHTSDCIKREIYSNLSATILPFFEENNHLWKIILHFGDMRKWDSLEDLFSHLFYTSDDSYSVSLRKLYNLLL